MICNCERGGEVNPDDSNVCEYCEECQDCNQCICNSDCAYNAGDMRESECAANGCEDCIQSGMPEKD